MEHCTPDNSCLSAWCNVISLQRKLWQLIYTAIPWITTSPKNSTSLTAPILYYYEGYCAYTRCSPLCNSIFDRHNLSLHTENDVFNKSWLRWLQQQHWFMRFVDSTYKGGNGVCYTKESRKLNEKPRTEDQIFHYRHCSFRRTSEEWNCSIHDFFPSDIGY